MTTRAAIYTRISQHNDNIPKVENQEAMCRALAAKEGYTVVRVFVDDGISAFSFAHREDWEQMLKDVEAGKFDVLLAQSESRFSRQPLEKENLMVACNNAGVKLHTINEGKTDPSLPDGEFMIAIRGLVDRMMVGTSQINSKKSNDAHRAKGLVQRGGIRPFGYTVDKKTVHPVEGPLILEATKGYLAGKKSLSKIRTEWNEAGHLPDSGKPWTHNKVRQVLLRPRNAGLVQHRDAILRDEKGELIKGEWKELITVEQWEALTVLVEAKAADVGRKVEPKWLCSSVALCGSCGKKMRLAMRNKNEPSYRCAAHETGSVKKSGVRHTSIAAKLLDEAVTSAVVDAVLFAPTSGVSEADDETLKALNLRLAEIRRAEANLLELVETETFTAGEVATKRAKLKVEAEDIQRGQASILGGNVRASLITESRAALWSGETVSIKDTVMVKAEIREKFEALALDQRRALIEGMLKVVVVNGRGANRVHIEHAVATGLN